jgi:hypothetical protein
MAITQLNKTDWGAYFDRLSKKLTVEQAEIKVASLNLGNQLAAEWVALRGVTYDHQDDILVISLDGLEHIVHRPKQVFVDEEAGVLASFEAIDAEEAQHIVQLRQPLALPFDVVDEAGEETFPASDPPSWAGS